MECPKCGFEISERETVCPNCKRVLKIVCPKCKTINKTNTCKRCGYVILTKCNKCRKVNLTEFEKCKRCGFDLEKSVILNDANTDEFACLVIDFPSMADISSILGSGRYANKFKNNIDKIIQKYAYNVNCRRQYINKSVVIRFLKEYSFKSSAKVAMNTAINILTDITKMNYKLTNRKNKIVRCNMFLMKRSTQDDPYDFDTGYNINMVNQSSDDKKEKLKASYQLIADNYIEEVLRDLYDFDTLSSVSVNGEMRTFYQINAMKNVAINFRELDESIQEVEIPNFVQNMLVEQDKIITSASGADKFDGMYDIYDIETLDFDEIKCEFIRTENIDVFYHVASKLQTTPKGIVALKTDTLYSPYSVKLLAAINDLNLYSNIITVTCYDEMSYSPYAFFKSLISAIFEYTVSQKLFSENDFSMFASIDKEGLIKDLITLNPNFKEDKYSRDKYFDIFLTLLQAIPNTLIYIENFDKIDSSSYDVIKYLFNSFEQLDISYLVEYSKDFSLHKDMHYLLTKPYYTEITLKPTPFEKMVADNKNYYAGIMDSFYFQRIAKYSVGSILFLDIAIQYLIESGVFADNGDVIKVATPKTLIIPSSLNKLIKRRLDLLKDYPDSIKFLASIALLGPRIDELTINSLGFENTKDIISRLTEMGYIYYYNNCLYFSNYNLLKENLIEVLDSTVLKEIVNLLLAKVYNSDMPSPEKAYLYRLIKDYKSEFKEWENLAQINLVFKDYNAYLNCADKILKILDLNTDLEAQEDIDKYKLMLYENIAQNMYDYIPENTVIIADKTLQYLEKTKSPENIINLCNKMIQSAMRDGHYMRALELTHKVLSYLPNCSIDPATTNFNKYYFLMTIVHIEILFNIGALEDCLDLGYNVLNVINEENLDLIRPDYMSKSQFEKIIIDTIGYIAFANVLQLKGNVRDFLNIVRSDFKNIPHGYDAFIALEALMYGREYEYDESLVASDNKFSTIIYHLLEAFKRCRHDYKLFAEEVYEAKILAKSYHLSQIELFIDLMIGYAYLKLCSFRKASAIFYQVIKNANEDGLNNVLYVAWYLMSELYIAEGKYVLAKGIISNSLIQLEKDSRSNEYLVMLFKYNMYKIFVYKNDEEKANICLAQANYIANKYGIIFEFDTNPAHYVALVDPDDEISGTLYKTVPIDIIDEVSPEEDLASFNSIENISESPIQKVQKPDNENEQDADLIEIVESQDGKINITSDK